MVKMENKPPVLVRRMIYFESRFPVLEQVSKVPEMETQESSLQEKKISN